MTDFFRNTTAEPLPIRVMDHSGTEVVVTTLQPGETFSFDVKWSEEPIYLSAEWIELPVFPLPPMPDALPAPELKPPDIIVAGHFAYDEWQRIVQPSVYLLRKAAERAAKDVMRRG